ncbi:hypothetical protein ACKKBF_B19125 [Auxenochlorella protothecoides x Auxenochlorella symbiontica]
MAGAAVPQNTIEPARVRSSLFPPEPRRKILPARVQKVEVDPAFVSGQASSAWVKQGSPKPTPTGLAPHNAWASSPAADVAPSVSNRLAEPRAAGLEPLERRLTGVPANRISAGTGEPPKDILSRRRVQPAAPAIINDKATTSATDAAKSSGVSPLAQGTPSVEPPSLCAQRSAPGTTPPEAPAPSPPAALSDAGRRLAALHGALLSSCVDCRLEGELEFLCNLLAVAADCEVDPVLRPVTVLWRGLLAHEYAVAVLSRAGNLVQGLDRDTLSALGSHPALSAAPQLAAAVARALDRDASATWHTAKAYEMVKPGLLSLLGLPMGNSDATLSTRTPEEQRRVSNREACRDGLLRLLKDASMQLQSLGRWSGAPSACLETASLSSDGADLHGEAVVWASLQSASTDLLRRLRPDNLPFLAALFTAAVLGSAATGESLLDGDLADLASRDVPRFERLNRRMHGPGSGAAGPRRARPGPQHAAPGFARRGTAGAGPPPAAGAEGGEESLASALRLAAEFPRAQRLYCLVLLAADSARFVACLAACMRARLRALTERGGGRRGGCAGDAGPAAAEQAVAAASLAAFLSLMTFAVGAAGEGGRWPGEESEASPGGDPVTTVTPRSPPPPPHGVDLLTPLAAACADPALLPATLPWVTRYLWFLAWDGEARAAPHYRAALRLLARLAASPKLLPGDARFGPAARCLRGVLDAFAAHCPLWPGGGGGNGRREVGGQGVGPPDRGAVAGPDAVPGPGASFLPEPAAGAAMARTADPRLLALCCPGAERCQRLLSQRGDSAGAPLRAARKITPTAPRRVPDGTQTMLHAVPPGVPAAPAKDPMLAQLQRSFLDQYSTEDHVVKLKEVVGFAADVIGLAVAEEVGNACCAAALASLDERLAAVAEQLVGGSTADASSDAAGADSSASGQTPPPQPTPNPHSVLTEAAEALYQQEIGGMVAHCREAAASQTEARAIAALRGLAPPGLEVVPVGTAAGIVAETALATASQTLARVVPGQLRAGLQRAAERHANKASKRASLLC